MTSRERVLTALRHEEPDRVPIDLGGMLSTGIMAMAYACRAGKGNSREGRRRCSCRVCA